MLRRRLRPCLPLICAVSLAGCGSSAGPGGESYALHSVVGDTTLPARDPETFFAGELAPLEITAGSVTLRSDGTVTETIWKRCLDPLPDPFTACEVVDGGRSTREGRYSRADGWVEFNGRRTGAAFAPAEVTIRHGNQVTPLPFVYRR